MVLVSIGSQSNVAALLVVEKALQSHLLRQAIRLIRRIGRGPIHGALELFHRFGWQLHLAMARLAIFQLLEILFVQGEAAKVRKLRRVTEFSKRPIGPKVTERGGNRRKHYGKVRGRKFV